MKHGLAALLAVTLLAVHVPSVWPTPRVAVSNDDAVTTLSIALNLALDESYRDGDPAHNHLVAINDRFRSMMDHPFVLTLRELLYTGQIGYALHVGLAFEAPTFGPSAHRLARGGASPITTMGTALAAFYADADIQSYIAEFETLYSRAAELLSESIDVDDQIRFLESFWGMRFSEYQFVPVPTVPVGHDFGSTLVEGDDYTACFLVGPERSIPTPRYAIGAIALGYYQTQWIGSTAVHEFGHSFYGVCLENLVSGLVEASVILVPQTELIDGYGSHEQNWQGYTEEYLVRSVDILYVSASEGAIVAEAALQRAESKGFGAIRFFYEKAG